MFLAFMVIIRYWFWEKKACNIQIIAQSVNHVSVKQKQNYFKETRQQNTLRAKGMKE